MLDKKSKKTPAFEVAMQRLEAIVHELEAGDIPLERLVKTYEEGLAYQKICQSHLERVDLLLKRLDDDGIVGEASVRKNIENHHGGDESK